MLTAFYDLFGAVYNSEIACWDPNQGLEDFLQ